MNIELKNIRTIAGSNSFSAILHIDGKMVATVSNKRAGFIELNMVNFAASEIISQAERFCNSRPKPVYPAGRKDDVFTIFRFIETRVKEYSYNKQIAIVSRHIEKEMIDGIIFGDPKSYINKKKYSRPISEILKRSTGIELLRSEVERVRKLMLPDEIILNTNLPEEVLKIQATIQKLKSPERKQSLKVIRPLPGEDSQNMKHH